MQSVLRLVTTLFALAVLLGTSNAHAQTYQNLYSPWMPWDTRIKYIGSVSLLDASGKEVNKAPLSSLFNSITVAFPAQVGNVTVTKVRVTITGIGTTNGVADLDLTTTVNQALTPPYVIPAGAIPTLAYTAMSVSPTLVATAPMPIVVPPPVADMTPPVVSITAPLAGASFVGTNPLTASASDNVGVSGVQFQIDGANYAAEITAAPYSTVWNSTTVADGAHTVAAIARDAAGNKATSALITVTVSNAPPPPVGIVPSKPGDSVPPLAQLYTADKAKWTLVGNVVFRNGVDMNVPYTDVNMLYISGAGALRANSNTHGYICYGTGWGAGC